MPVAIDPGIIVSDSDSPARSPSATVAIATNYARRAWTR